MSMVFARRSLLLVFAFILGTTALAKLAYSDEPGIRRIGVLYRYVNQTAESGLRDGLHELGYIEGRNIAIDWRREANPTDEKLRSIVIEWARLHTDVIVAFGTPEARVVLQATTVPVVFVAGDPVGTGLAESLARPGGRGTGVSMLNRELAGKRMELLKQIAPGLQRIAFLMNSTNPLDMRMLAEAQGSARTLGIKLAVFDARTASELDARLRTMSRNETAALLVSNDQLFLGNRAKITQTARKARLPAIFPFKEYHEDGALIMEWTLPTRYGIGCAKVEARFYHLRERERQDEGYSSWDRFGKDGFPSARDRREGQDGAAQTTEAIPGAGVLRQPALLRDRHGSVRERTLLGA